MGQLAQVWLTACHDNACSYPTMSRQAHALEMYWHYMDGWMESMIHGGGVCERDSVCACVRERDGMPTLESKMPSISLNVSMSDLGSCPHVCCSLLMGAEPSPATIMAIMELKLPNFRQCYSINQTTPTQWSS